MFFDKKNRQIPQNQGECRQTLNMLKECGYNEGLLNFLNTDKLTGIVGTDSDLKRRREMYGKNKIALPTITSFMDLLYRQFEDSNI